MVLHRRKWDWIAISQVKGTKAKHLGWYLEENHHYIHLELFVISICKSYICSRILFSVTVSALCGDIIHGFVCIMYIQMIGWVTQYKFIERFSKITPKTPTKGLAWRNIDVINCQPIFFVPLGSFAFNQNLVVTIRQHLIQSYPLIITHAVGNRLHMSKMQIL